MNSIRKLVAMGSGAAALLAVTAFVLAPVTVLAEGSHRSHPKTESAQRFTANVETAVAPTATCTTARQALKNAVAAGKAEDVAERNAVKDGSLKADADKAEDLKEKADMKALRDKARTACAGQPKVAPTAACSAAKKALKDAVARKDSAAALKALKDAKHAACAK
ncbi:MAG TPA: hypothetical protein VGU71_06695 [Candidatus Dormibacteraeota bacterium]|nr:hypothetical protein [Candidatus Dormibacteraeota bacterium]